MIVPKQETALGLIHTKLLDLGWTIVTAESLTAGLISATLASCSGSSAYLRGGFVVYDIDMKVDVLGVDRTEAEKCNCVSDAIAVAMALGARGKTQANCVIAVTGYAEPWPEGGVDEPFAYYTVLCGDAMKVSKFIATGSRNEFRAALVDRVLRDLAAMLETAG